MPPCSLAGEIRGLILTGRLVDKWQIRTWRNAFLSFSFFFFGQNECSSSFFYIALLGAVFTDGGQSVLKQWKFNHWLLVAWDAGSLIGFEWSLNVLCWIKSNVIAVFSIWSTVQPYFYQPFFLILLSWNKEDTQKLYLKWTSWSIGTSCCRVSQCWHICMQNESPSHVQPCRGQRFSVADAWSIWPCAHHLHSYIIGAPCSIVGWCLLGFAEIANLVPQHSAAIVARCLLKLIRLQRATGTHEDKASELSTRPPFFFFKWVAALCFFCDSDPGAECSSILSKHGHGDSPEDNKPPREPASPANILPASPLTPLPFPFNHQPKAVILHSIASSIMKPYKPVICGFMACFMKVSWQAALRMVPVTLTDSITKRKGALERVGRAGKRIGCSLYVGPARALMGRGLAAGYHWSILRLPPFVRPTLLTFDLRSYPHLLPANQLPHRSINQPGW